MDVWRWIHKREKTLVQEGEHRLVTLLDALPERVVNMRHAEVDAIVPEALALVRSRNDPWLEVFVRHWELQSKVFQRREGERALGAAVALVEFSHRDETRACPQSVCSVQDLAACYGIVDGPGWAPERLEVSNETLARIDPTWACFDCISSEYADALRDRGDAEGSLRFIDAQRARLAATPKHNGNLNEFGSHARTHALIDLKRYDEALASLDALLSLKQHSSFRTLWRRAARALCLARTGRHDEARDALIDPTEALTSPGCYELWSETVTHLVHEKTISNSLAISRTLAEMCTRLDTAGSVRSALTLASRHGHLAVARGERWTASRALALMQRCVPRLRAPLDALDLIAKLREAVATLDATTPRYENADEALASLDDVGADTLDQALAVAEISVRTWPDHEALALRFATLLSAAGLASEGVSQIEQWVATHTPTLGTALMLGESLMHDDPERFERYARDLAERAPTEAIRVTPALFRGLKAIEREAWGEARTHLAPLLSVWPEAVRTRRAYTQTLIHLGEASEALQVLDALAVLVPDDRGDHWDRMTAATMLGDHARVRASAAALALPLSSTEGAIEEHWEECVLQLDGHAVRAVRTGPVTAHVRVIARPGEPSQYNDHWVFDARPCNDPLPHNATDDQREAHRWVYRGVKRLSEGGWRSFEIDGAAPSDEERARLIEALGSLGCALRGRAGEGYTLAHLHNDGQRVDGLYLCVAAPPTLDDATLHARLVALNETLALPLLWTALARQAGDEATANAHAALAKSYGVPAD